MTDKTPWAEREILVWGELSRSEETCEFGSRHLVKTYGYKRLSPVVGTREHYNGYERRQTELRTDRQGRVYHKHVEIDFHSNTWWLRDGDKAHFQTHPPRTSVRTVWQMLCTKRKYL